MEKGTKGKNYSVGVLMPDGQLVRFANIKESSITEYTQLEGLPQNYEVESDTTKHPIKTFQDWIEQPGAFISDIHESSREGIYSLHVQVPHEDTGEVASKAFGGVGAEKLSPYIVSA